MMGHRFLLTWIVLFGVVGVYSQLAESTHTNNDQSGGSELLSDHSRVRRVIPQDHTNAGPSAEQMRIDREWARREREKADLRRRLKEEDDRRERDRLAAKRREEEAKKASQRLAEERKAMERGRAEEAERRRKAEEAKKAQNAKKPSGK